VTDSFEHRACSEALGAYALRALPEDEAERVRRHLEECPACRAELDRLQVAVEALPASVEQIEPPPELKSRLMSIVESEAEVRRAGREAADRPPTKSRWRRLPRWLPVAGAVAAACAVAAVIVLLAAGGGAATRTVEAQVSAPLRAGGAVATLKITGDRAKLIVARLPAPPAGYVHELWVKHGSAPPEPAGTFVVRSGSVDVARPVRAGDQVLVTAEPGHGTSAPTSAPLIVARV
jgi:anti-sigma-K factor RskA